VEAIITGISFLGAGTIFRHARTQHVEGLTTAASLLLCGAVGIAVALRQFVLAFGATLLTITVLRGLKLVEDRLKRFARDGAAKS
jgi:putative Mg2+ transporter-C (MgtC) family protein